MKSFSFGLTLPSGLPIGPKPRLDGMESVRLPPTFIVLTPSFHPLMIWPSSTWNFSGFPLLLGSSELSKVLPSTRLPV